VEKLRDDQRPQGPSRAGDKAPYARGPRRASPLPFGQVPGGTTPNTQAVLEGRNDARTGMPPGMPGGAMCVQRFDDSRNSAIHITYRISLRSSSMPEPRDPLLKVLIIIKTLRQSIFIRVHRALWRARARGRTRPPATGECPVGPPKQQGILETRVGGWTREGSALGNDPSAGSPTETLLRLLLPLNDQV
jgi:hypothetical protein